MTGNGNSRSPLPFADPVPPNTKQYQLILTKYQQVSSYTDPEPSSTTYNLSSRTAQFNQLNLIHLMSHALCVAQYTWSSLKWHLPSGVGPPPLMAQISIHFLPHFFSFAVESYIYETDFTLGLSQK